MSLEVGSLEAICSRCGKKYPHRKGNFSVCYGDSYRGVGYLHICKQCIENMYNKYLSQCNDSRKAVRQMCRKLDLYYSDSIYNSVENKTTKHTIMTTYITRISNIKNAGKSFDDTLKDEEALWSFGNDSTDKEEVVIEETPIVEENEDIYIPEKVIMFWGPGYTPSMYNELQQRFDYWKTEFPKNIEIDIGTEAILRQICFSEIDINRDRAAGRSTDKKQTLLNNLIGSLGLKPTQKKSDDLDASVENTPFGVWIRKWEEGRPVPEPDSQFKDVDGVVSYIEVWFKGHLSKMIGLKNSFSKMYEKAIEKLRVSKPEFQDEDDEEVFNDIFGDDNNE